jgi:hypothetical protein
LCGDRICVGRRFASNQNAWFLSWAFMWSNEVVMTLAGTLLLIGGLVVAVLFAVAVCVCHRRALFASLANMIFGGNYGSVRRVRGAAGFASIETAPLGFGRIARSMSDDDARDEERRPLRRRSSTSSDEGPQLGALGAASAPVFFRSRHQR